MNKRLQIILTDEAWAAVEALEVEANREFDMGTVHFSDVINEMILCSKVDVKTLQLKHMDLKRTLKSIASRDDLDLDSAIKCLTELKARTQKRQPKTPSNQDAG